MYSGSSRSFMAARSSPGGSTVAPARDPCCAAYSRKPVEATKNAVAMPTSTVAVVRMSASAPTTRAKPSTKATAACGRESVVRKADSSGASSRSARVTSSASTVAYTRLSSSSSVPSSHSLGTTRRSRRASRAARTVAVGSASATGTAPSAGPSASSGTARQARAGAAHSVEGVGTGCSGASRLLLGVARVATAAPARRTPRARSARITPGQGASEPASGLLAGTSRTRSEPLARW